MNQRSTQPDPPARSVCGRCGGETSGGQVVELRTGGTTGGWKLVFGELAELGEQMLPVEVWACSRCGHIDLYRA